MPDAPELRFEAANVPLSFCGWRIPAPFQMDHAFERLGRAVEDLATRPGSLRERVIDAYSDHLLVLLPQEFDDDIRRDFENLMKTLGDIIDRASLHPEPWILELHGGPFEIAKHKIRERTARKIAKSIWRLYANVRWTLTHTD